MQRPRTARITLALALLATPVAWAQTRPDFDPDTGMNLRHEPKSRDVNFTHMALDLVIPDMTERVLRGRELLRFTPIGHLKAELVLDARLLDIDDVTSPGREADYIYDGRRLKITLDRKSVV